MNRALLGVILIVGLGLLYPLQKWIDNISPRASGGEETLYFSSGAALKKMSLGLDGLLADIYWIRTVQYFGRKIVEHDKPVNIYDLSDIRMDLLIPLLNIVTDLDPEHISAYRFGAIFLPERDVDAAVTLLERGIERNPDEWRLYQDLGYIYWQKGDYSKAAEVYDRGATMQGARAWMRDLAGLMRIKGGSHEAARTIYEGYLKDPDPNVSAQAQARINQLDASDEINLLNAVLARYQQQFGTCPGSLQVLAPLLSRNGFSLNEARLPVDPAGYPYVLDPTTCRVDRAAESPIPR